MVPVSRVLTSATGGFLASSGLGSSVLIQGLGIFFFFGARRWLPTPEEGAMGVEEKLEESWTYPGPFLDLFSLYSLPWTNLHSWTNLTFWGKYLISYFCLYLLLDFLSSYMSFNLQSLL